MRFELHETALLFVIKLFAQKLDPEEMITNMHHIPIFQLLLILVAYCSKKIIFTVFFSWDSLLLVDFKEKIFLRTQIYISQYMILVVIIFIPIFFRLQVFAIKDGSVLSALYSMPSMQAGFERKSYPCSCRNTWSMGLIRSQSCSSNRRKAKKRDRRAKINIIPLSVYWISCSTR